MPTGAQHNDSFEPITPASFKRMLGGTRCAGGRHRVNTVAPPHNSGGRGYREALRDRPHEAAERGPRPTESPLVGVALGQVPNRGSRERAGPTVGGSVL